MSSDPKGPEPTPTIYDLIEQHRPLYETGGHGPWSYCGCAIAKQIRVLNRFPALPYEAAHDKLAATIAELQREIEGYRQALSERWVCRAHRAGEQGEHQVGNSDCDYARRILGQI